MRGAAQDRPEGVRSFVIAINRAVLSFTFLRFIGGGLINTIFGYATFLTALHLGAGVGIALVTSMLLGVIFNFQTSRHLVFRSRRAGRLLRFTAVYAVALSINYLAILPLERLGLESWAAQAFMLVPMAALTFTLQRYFVFGDERGRS